MAERLDIKPLSVNDAWRGRRFKTPEYKRYIRDVLLILRPCKIPDGPLELHLTFGFSSKGSDIDNPIKCFVDCLQKKYGFNDSRIYKLVVIKEVVKKGSEFIEWDIKTRYLESVK